MASLKEKIVHELKLTALITLFFFVGFNLLVLLLVLLVPEHRDAKSYFIAATILALVVGKVMVILESLSLDRRMGRNTFLGMVFKKSLLFILAVIFALTLEEIIHGMITEGFNVREAFHHGIANASGPLFLAKVIYMMVLFILYSFLTELDKYLGSNDLGDIVLSKFRNPVKGTYWVLRGGFLNEKARNDASFAQEIYFELGKLVHLHKGQVETYGGFSSAIIWEDKAGEGRLKPVKLIADFIHYLEENKDALSKRFGKLSGIKAVLDTGEAEAIELGGGAHKEIRREGEVFRRAEALLKAYNGPGLLANPVLADELSSAGYNFQPLEIAVDGKTVNMLEITFS